MSLQNRLILIFTMTYSNYIIKASLSLSGYNIRPKHTWLFEWGRIIRISCSCSFLKVSWSFYISTTYVILFWITHPWVHYPKQNMILQTGLFKRQCVHLSNSTNTHNRCGIESPFGHGICIGFFLIRWLDPTFPH